MRAVLFLGLVLVLGAGIGCSRPPAWPPDPARFLPGEEVCSECRMYVSDQRFAVQAHTPAGDLAWYDDIGCLLLARGARTIPEGIFVHDFLRETWVRGDSGFAVRTPHTESPMGFGWTVHAAPEDARAAARAPGSELLPLPELLQRGTAESPRPSPEPTPEIPGQD